MNRFFISLLLVSFFAVPMFSQNNVIILEDRDSVSIKYDVIDMSSPLKSGNTIVAISKNVDGKNDTLYYLTNSLDALKKTLNITNSMIENMFSITNEKSLKEMIDTLNGEFPNIKNWICIGLIDN